MSDKPYPGDDAIIIAIYDQFGVSMKDAERWFREAKDQRIAELVAKVDALQTDIVDAYELLDKAWGPLNAGQMQCNSCSAAYAYLDEAMTNLKSASEDTRKEKTDES